MRIGAFWRRVHRAAQTADAIDDGRARQAHRSLEAARSRTLAGMLATAVLLTLLAVAFASAQTAEQEDARLDQSSDDTRYAELSDSAAWSLAQRVLPHDPDALPLGDRVRPTARAAAAGKAKRKTTKAPRPSSGRVEYLSDHTALLHGADAGAPATFVASAAPLRARDTKGRLRALDLRLKPRGRAFLAPANAGTDVLLARDLRRSSLLRDVGLRVRPVVTRGGKVTARRAARAFFANAGASTDVTLAAEAGGMQAMWVLRARTSPEELRLRLGGAKGVRIKARRGGAFQVRDRRRRKLAIVLPPVAWDADKKPVAVRASHRGSELVYTVDHRRHELRYPIVVDPLILSESFNGATSTDFTGWAAGPSPAAGHTTSQTGASGAGLYLNWTLPAGQATTTPPGAHEWRYPAPGTSIITKFSSGPLTMNPSTTCAQPGLRTSTHAVIQSAGVCGTTTGNQDFVAAQTTANRSNYAYLQHQPPAGLTTASVVMRSTTLELTDTDNPTIGAIASTPAHANWVKAGPMFLRPTLSDTGLGAKSAKLLNTDSSTLDSDVHACTGLRASRCAATWNTVTYTPQLDFNTVNLSEGQRVYTISATDVVGNTATTPVTLKVDRTVPWVKFGNELGDWPFVKDTIKNLDVRGTDGWSGETNPSYYASGVVRIALAVEGVAQAPDSTQTCVHSCELTRTIAFNGASHAHGARIVKATVTDQAGNVEVRDFPVFVDKKGPRLSLSGPLKDAGSSTLTKESYRLHVDAHDGIPGGLERESGVDSIEVLWEQSGVRTRLDYLHKACETDSCSQDHDYTFEPRRFSGPGTLVVRSLDDLGNASESSLALTPGATTFDTTNMTGLEEWMQYDSVQAGAGARAHVNQTTGNFVWNVLPLVNPGRGLATFANVTYNSQQAIAAGAYKEIGPGFSMGISGLTRVNEPIDLSREATVGEITIVDPDGTRHLFRRNGTYYEPPPGVNVHLRKFSNSDWARAWAATRPDGVTHFFDRRGYQTFIQDRTENILRYEYDIVPIKAGVTCPVWGLGDATFATTDCRQRLVGVTDSAGVLDGVPNRSVRLTYTASDGPIATVTDHAGRVLAFTYSGGRLTALTQADGTADERIFRFLYGAYGVAAVEDPRGAETLVTYGTGYLTKLAGATPAADALSDVRVEDLRQRDQRRRAYTYAKAAGAAAQWETKASDARSETTVYHTDHRGRTLQITDPRQTVSKLRWDGDNNVTQIAQATGTSDESITAMAYNEHGQLRWTSDGMDSRTELDYRVGEGMHIAEVGEGRGDFVSDLNRIEHPNGVATGDVDDWTELFELDVRGNVTARRDQEGNWAHTVFDRFGQVLKETDQVGNVTRYEQYDPSGHARVVIDPKDGRSEYRYDVVGNLLATTDARAAEHGGLADPQHRFQARFSYDALDQLVEEILPKDSRAGQFITRRYDYDVNGNELRAVDGEGAATTQVFDEMDRATAVKSPSVGHADELQATQEITRYAYDGEGNVIRMQSPRGEENQASDQDFSTDFEYNAKGELVVVRRHDVRGEKRTTLITSMGYDRRGNMIALADPRENTEAGDTPLENVAEGDVRWQYTYDKADRRVTQVEHPVNLWLETNFEYDRNDNLIAVTDPRWNTSRREYDQRDLLVAEIDQLGRRTQYERRADGKVDSTLSPRHFWSWSEDDWFREKVIYDALGDVVERQLPRWGDGVDPKVPYTWRYQRDAVGNPLFVTDPRGVRSENAFFDSGDLKSTTRPSLWKVDQGQKLVEKDWREIGNEGHQPELPSSEGEGDFGAVGQENMPGLLPKAGLVEAAYDDEMRLVSLTERDPSANGAATTIGRDAMGRPTSTRRPLDLGASRFIEEKTGYDRNGNVVTLTDGEGNVTRTAYDQFDRPVEETTPGSSDGTPDVTKTEYDANGQPIVITDPRGNRSHRCYDSADRLIESIDAEGQDTSTRYDNAGNVIRQVSPRGNPKWVEGNGCYPADLPEEDRFKTHYSYDAANQLKWVQEGIDTAKVTTFDYDADGNRTYESRPGSRSSAGGAIEPRQTWRKFDARGNRYYERTGTGAHQRTTVTEYDGMGNLRRKVNPKGVNGGDAAKLDTAPRQTSLSSEEDRSSTAVREATEHAHLFEYDDDNQLTAIHLPHGGGTDQQNRQSFHFDGRGRVSAIDAPNEWTRNPNVCSEDQLDPASTGSSSTKPGCVLRTRYTTFDTGWIKTSIEPEGKHPTTGAIGGETQRYDYDRRGLQTLWETQQSNGTPRRRQQRAYWPNGLLKQRRAEKLAIPPEPQEEGGWTTGPPNPAEAPRVYDYGHSSSGQLISVTDRGVKQGDEDTDDDRAYRMAYDKADRRLATDEDDGPGRTGKDTLVAFDRNGNTIKRQVDGSLSARVAGGVLASGTTYTGGTTNDFQFDDFDRETETKITRPGSPAPDVQYFRTSYYLSDDRDTRTELKQTGTATPVQRVQEQSFYADDGRKVQAVRKGGIPTAQTNQKDQQYTYDTNGNRTKDEMGTHEFNARDQLTKWTRKAEAGGSAVDYTLNGAGDVIKETDSKDSSTTDNRYAGGRLIEQVVTGGPAPLTSTYGYDATPGAGGAGGGSVGGGSGGNVTSIKERPTGQPASADQLRSTFTYDPFDRNTRQESFGTTAGDKDVVDYTFDGFDRRDTVKDAQTRSGSTSTKDANMSYVGTSESLSQRGAVNGSGDKQSSYDYDSGLDLLGLSRRGSNGTGATDAYKSYAKDVNGSTEGLTDDSGVNSSKYAYDPYGNDENSQGETGAPGSSLDEAGKDNPFRFQGFYRDSGVKTYDMKARQYLPQAGRFLTQDRFESSSGDFNLVSDPLTQNRYAFAGGNPISNVEFDGHNFLEDAADTVEEGVEDVKEEGEEFVSGAADGFKETAEAFKDPEKAVKGLAHAVTHPKETVETIAKSCEGRSISNCAGYATSQVVGGKGASALIKGGMRAGAKGAGGGGKGGSSKGSESKGGQGRKGGAGSKGGTGSRGSKSPGGRGAGSRGRQGRGSCTRNSFTGDTPVLMADGSTQPISTVSVGDGVTATDPVTGQTSARVVERLIVGRGVKSMVRVELPGPDTHATDQHPFWVESQDAWVDAEDLRAGDLLREPDGDLVEVEGIRTYSMVGSVFNLTVEGVHTYYAGDQLVLVHNCKRRTTKQEGERMAADAGHNRVTAQRPNGERLQIDMRGKPHRGVDTPHVREQTRNEGPGGETWSNKTKDPVPATSRDLRTARGLIKARRRAGKSTRDPHDSGRGSTKRRNKRNNGSGNT